ncbi:AraC family transcriptional regulator [Bradyrhizobium sp. CB1650]|uniref:helix-turn-helix transcriptional regulator n=1 Tax=Bradyrhizobium sp. CB1650 TaxID=3039153 RepID=UPI002435127D|nr:AraC family transcriptional regulator [Bradyrhizobium sp. CB1650]WGD50226.1 AraC family transcriptional regulator [Bradyrhizobium sp. CB1650]
MLLERLDMSVQTCDLQPRLAHAIPSQAEADSGLPEHAGPDSMFCTIGEIDAQDSLIQTLVEALTVAIRNNETRCVEALRLAIAVGQFGQAAGRPAAANQVTAHGRQVQALQKWRLKRVVDYIDASLSSKITLGDLAAIAGLSRMHFASQFRVATGVRPHEFLLQRRIRRAEQLMSDTTMTIMEVALTVGFQTQAHFTTVFKRFSGCTPRRWRVSNHMRPRTKFDPPAAELL